MSGFEPTPDQLEAAHRFGAGAGGYVARSAGCTCQGWDGKRMRLERDCPLHGMGDLAGDLAGGRTRRALRRARRAAQRTVRRPRIFRPTRPEEAAPDDD